MPIAFVANCPEKQKKEDWILKNYVKYSTVMGRPFYMEDICIEGSPL